MCCAECVHLRSGGGYYENCYDLRARCIVGSEFRKLFYIVDLRRIRGGDCVWRGEVGYCVGEGRYGVRCYYGCLAGCTDGYWP